MKRRARLFSAITVLLIVGFIAPYLPTAKSEGGLAVLDENLKLPPKQSHPKLESALSELVSGDPPRVRPNNVVGQGDKVRVVLEMDELNEAVVTDLENAGALIETTYATLVQAVVPISSLTTLADLHYTKFIRQPLVAIPTPHDPAEGVSIIGADLVQALGFTASGGKVAIIECCGGFDLTSPDIPAANVVECIPFGFASCSVAPTDHGTAVTEIVLDVAPDASLYLYNFNTDVDYLNAVDEAITKGVDIISMSFGFFETPVDGSGLIATKVDDAVANGILPVVAAGNQRFLHWEGQYIDTLADGFHEFLPGADETNAIIVGMGQVVGIFLTWDDWPTSNQDYDLLLFDSSLTLVDFSFNFQTGTQPPTEQIFRNDLTPGLYHIAINRFSATVDVNFDLHILQQIPQYVVSSGSVTDPAAAVGAFAVGAVDWVTPDTLESFSSEGPTNDGRIKPDVVAPDGVTTTTLSPFFGTSASTPHVAGAAALLLSARALRMCCRSGMRMGLSFKISHILLQVDTCRLVAKLQGLARARTPT